MAANEILDEVIAAYDRDSAADELASADSQRAEALATFPLEDWPRMPLERYSVGLPNNDENFCRWMEFVATDLGSIKGGSSRKLIVYKHATKPGWHFNEAAFADEQEAWLAVRAAFVEAFRLAEEGEWEAIDALPELKSGAALLLKSLYLYFPDDLLPICSRGHLRHYLAGLERPEADDDSLGPVRLNRALLAVLRENPRFADWTTKELERLLYASALSPFRGPRSARIIKVAPGEQASRWDECLAGGYIAVGWDEIGDLRDFDSYAEFEDAYELAFSEAHKGSRPTIKRQAQSLWTLTELEQGDLIVANKGISHVLAVGTVTDAAYEFDGERPDFRHLVRVDWDTGYEKDIQPQPQWRDTIVTVSDELRAEILGEKAPALIPPLLPRLSEALARKGQVVLYGPPGTGKTYQARRFAIWWLLERLGENGSAALLDAEAFAAAERRLGTASSAQTWVMVANPKEWSWDRLFAEKSVTYRRGRIQRNFPVVQAGDLVVGYQSTPEKRIVALARVEQGLASEDGEEPRIRLSPVRELQHGLSFEELREDEILRGSEPLLHRMQGTLFALSPGEAQYLLSRLDEREPGVLDAVDVEDQVPLLNWITFHPSYSYEDFVESMRPVAGEGGSFELRPVDGVFKEVCDQARADPERDYLILIDEINRANVARVFGELITLLEKDKRSLEVRLPQSRRRRFAVPPNVYVVGTMNTADRSIRLLDVALRRRFAFVELLPDLSLVAGVKVGDLDLGEFLGELNDRIARRAGREKQIGHAYLLDEGTPITDQEAFARVFRYEILPLLQEFAYDDYRQLAEYVGEDIVDVDAQGVRESVLNDPEQLIAAIQKAFTGPASED